MSAEPLATSRTRHASRGLTVALVGTDGVGKSTLAAAVVAVAGVPARVVHMGLYAGGATRRLPVPGLGTAVKLVRRRRAWADGRRHSAAGGLTLFDRYATDALLPAAAGADRWRRLRRRLLAAAVPPADLTVLLDAPGRVLARRIGGDPAAHERRRQAVLRTLEGRPGVVVLDATRPTERLRDQVLALVEPRLAGGAR